MEAGRRKRETARQRSQLAEHPRAAATQRTTEPAGLSFRRRNRPGSTSTRRIRYPTSFSSSLTERSILCGKQLGSMNKLDTRRRSERKGKELMNFQAHLHRLQNVKPAIDNSEPKKHPLSNKKERLKRREYALIEQNNKILLDRLAKIVQTKTIDNEMSADTQKHHELKRRLGLLKKREEMQKITEDNQRLLKRIQDTPPAYNHLEWEESARKLEAFKKTMALYPEFYDRQDRDRRKSSAMGSRSGLKTPASRGNTTTLSSNTYTSLPKLV